MSDDTRWFQDKEHPGVWWVNRPCPRVLVTVVQEVPLMLEDCRATLGCPCSIPGLRLLLLSQSSSGAGALPGGCSQHHVVQRQALHPCGGAVAVRELVGWPPAWEAGARRLQLKQSCFVLPISWHPPCHVAVLLMKLQGWRVHEPPLSAPANPAASNRARCFPV